MTATQDSRSYYYVGPISPDDRAKMTPEEIRAMKTVFEAVYNESQRILALKKGEDEDHADYPESLRNLIEHDLKLRADVGKAVLLRALGTRNEDVLTHIKADILDSIPDIFVVVDRRGH